MTYRPGDKPFSTAARPDIAAPSLPSTAALRAVVHADEIGGVRVRSARFEGAGGVVEQHFTLCPTRHGDAATQLAAIEAAHRQAAAAAGLGMDTQVLRRLFCSDPANQRGVLDASEYGRSGAGRDMCAVSRVGMAPVPPARLAAWAWHVHDPLVPLDKRRDGSAVVLDRGGLSHRWSVGLQDLAGASSYEQTRDVLAQYDVELAAAGMSWLDAVVRTWLYVRDIGRNYDGVVRARRELFERRGLTAATHFIASTGIEGTGASPDTLLVLDAYAVRGLRPGQMSFLNAPDHLRSPHHYGVTFERGAAIDYRDRRHLFISGTASIDPDGTILHVGDIAGQLDRTLENVEALLRSGGATLKDMAVMTAYVRDPADAAWVAGVLGERCPDAAFEVFTAPVCRPGWLVEIEGIAAIRADRADLPAF